MRACSSKFQAPRESQQIIQPSALHCSNDEVSSSDEDSEDAREVRARPKTRGAILSFVDEDLDQIADALKDRSKGIKKWHAKLKSEYGREKVESDSDWELKEPQEDDDLVYDDKEKPSSSVASRRGKSRRGRPKAWSSILQTKKTKKRRKVSITEPEITPLCQSCLEFDDMTYHIGDIVKIPQSVNETSFAQIIGFLKDQFCEKYTEIKWLIPTNIPFDKHNFDPASFVDGQVHQKPVNMRSVMLVMRIPETGTKKTCHDQKIVELEDGAKSMDNPSFTLSSVDHKWYQLIY